jgi:hypothetical protein
MSKTGLSLSGFCLTLTTKALKKSRDPSIQPWANSDCVINVSRNSVVESQFQLLVTRKSGVDGAPGMR